MEPIFDEELNKAIEDYEKFAISSLVSMKHKDVSTKSSLKTTEWKNYVKKVHEEISDNGRLKIPYSKAMGEASRRRRISTNTENLHKIRQTKVIQNRSKKESETQTEVGFKSSFVEICGYKIKKNDNVLLESEFYFEDITKCISNGIVKILNLYMKEVPYEFFEIPEFRKYYEESNEEIKNFINCLVYTHYNKIYNQSYKVELYIIDLKFLKKFSKDSLDIFWYVVNYIFKNSNKFFHLVICPRVLIRKID
jgi:hypothetical protein